MNNVYYEWKTYLKDGQEKKFIAYFILVGEVKISIKPTNEYNYKLIDGARNLGLITQYEN